MRCTKHLQQVAAQLRGTVSTRTSLTRAVRSSSVGAVTMLVRLPERSLSTATVALPTATAVSAPFSPHLNDLVLRVSKRCLSNASKDTLQPKTEPYERKTTKRAQTVNISEPHKFDINTETMDLCKTERLQMEYTGNPYRYHHASQNHQNINAQKM